AILRPLSLNAVNGSSKAGLRAEPHDFKRPAGAQVIAAEGLANGVNVVTSSKLHLVYTIRQSECCLAEYRELNTENSP
ncbi:MAG TPA: hypothetical protein DDW52_25945, partial [Planctomycetaceae bacterium]|nr:hypothetical protein [Planctomycetaceae bacterium]